MFLIGVYLFFAIILLYKVKLNSNADKKYFLDSFNDLRGLFALEIIIGHVIAGDDTLLYPFTKFLIVSVAFFFFVSAWGLANAFDNKKDYLKSFLLSKCLYLLSLAVITFILDSIITRNYNFEPNILYNFFVMTNWYIWELMGFYVLFYLVYKHIGRYRIMVISIITVGSTIILYLLGVMQSWYTSAWAFPAGLFFYEYFDAIYVFFKGLKGKLLILLMTAVGMISFWSNTDRLFEMVFLRNIICLAVLGLMFCIFIYISLGENKVLRILGKYSLELYLYQFTFIRVVDPQIDYRLRILLICALTGFTALLLHPVNVKIRKLTHK